MFNQELANKIVIFLNSRFPEKAQIGDLRVALPEFSAIPEEEWLKALDALNQDGRVEFRDLRTGLNNALQDAANITISQSERKTFTQTTAKGDNHGAAQQPLIFVSCGQSTDGERSVGQQIARLVEQLTDCRAYFAENQNTLEGVTENILNKLHNAAGFIAVMHPRGDISNSSAMIGQNWVRGSVWVEQEIAIAAYISQVLQRPLRVRAYVHRSILREGLRDKLHLNPKLFTEDSEIVKDLAVELLSWRNLAQPRQSLFEQQHRHLAEEKVSKLSTASKNLVRYLLHHGKTEATDLAKQCTPQDQFHDAIQKAHGLGLVKDTVAGNPARPSTLYFWEVHPNFEIVLRELL